MIASPLPRPPRKSPTPAISNARTTMPSDRAIRSRPRTGSRRPVISARLTPARTANSAADRPPARACPKESVPSGSRSSMTWVVTMPSSARQRATSRPTRRSGASSRLRNRPCAHRMTRRGPPCPSPPPHRGARPGSRSSAAAGRGHRQPGCGRRAARRCGRCRPRRSATGTPAGHLHDREQRVHAVEVLERHGYADHRQRRDRGEHARQVGGPAGAGDDHLEPAPGGLPAVGQHLVGHPVRRDDVGLVRDVELRQRARRPPSSPASRSRTPSRCPRGRRCHSTGLTRSRFPGRRGTTRRRAAPARGSRPGRRRTR